MMKAERLAEIKTFNPKPTDSVDWTKLQTAVLEYLPELVAEVERLQSENEQLKCSLLFIAKRRESNADWAQAHNALAVYGRPKEERY